MFTSYSSSLSVCLCTLGTIGIISTIFYATNFDKLSEATNQSVQTDKVLSIDLSSNYNSVMTKSTSTQCDLHLLTMEEDGEMQIISTPSVGTRWFFFKGLLT